MNTHRVFLPEQRHLADANALLRHPADCGSWIWHPGRSRHETAFVRFRLIFMVSEACRPVLHVTADQRFQMRCDGEDVSYGPDRCDLEHWTVQSVQLELSAGAHELEVLAWWIAEPESLIGRSDANLKDETPKPPMAQMTWAPGFLLYTDDLAPESVNTGSAPWLAEDLTPAVTLRQPSLPGYHDVGPCYHYALDEWRARNEKPAVVVRHPLVPNATGVRTPGWCLFPAVLPEQQRERWTGGRIRAVREGWQESAFTEAETLSPHIAEFQQLITGSAPVTIPPHRELTVLCDFETYVCGYPNWSASGGRDALLEWSWAEALYEERSTADVSANSSKGNRSEVCQKSFRGLSDEWLIGENGAPSVPSLWWRAGRFVRLRIRTADEPLVLESLAVIRTGYPLVRAGEWHSSEAEWDALMPLFEHSFRCSAHETWTDTPYYEQMCYVGDNLMHGRSNFAWFPDDRISKRSLQLFDWSRHGSGFVAERYPSAWRQESITYSMLWPIMIRDFVLWRDEPAFVQKLLPGLRAVLAEMESLVSGDHLMHESPGWPFVDWLPEWKNGCGPGVLEGDSSIVNLHWVLCLQAAAEVEDAHGDTELADRNRRLARTTFDAILARYWDDSHHLLRDTTPDAPPSEQAQFFALLTGLLSPAQTEGCLSALRSNSSLARATISASFYLLDALYQHRDESEFHKRLQFWPRLMDFGFCATPEGPEPSRSDAHAWGAHPAWHTLASIAGVRPAAPGFTRVRIAPLPGPFRFFKCAVVHPHGMIEVDLRFENGGASGAVTLPDGVTGEFVWNGAVRVLQAGRNDLI